MGCIQPKKLIKISQSPKDGSKNDSNKVAIHNIRKDTTDNVINKKNIQNDSKKENSTKIDDKMIHSNSQTFKFKTPINDQNQIILKKIVVISIIVKVILKKSQKYTN